MSCIEINACELGAIELRQLGAARGSYRKFDSVAYRVDRGLSTRYLRLTDFLRNIAEKVNYFENLSKSLKYCQFLDHFVKKFSKRAKEYLKKIQ